METTDILHIRQFSRNKELRKISVDVFVELTGDVYGRDCTMQLISLLDRPIKPIDAHTTFEFLHSAIDQFGCESLLNSIIWFRLGRFALHSDTKCSASREIIDYQDACRD